MLFQSLDKLKRNAIMTTIILMFIGNVLMFVPETHFAFLFRFAKGSLTPNFRRKRPFFQQFDTPY